MIHPDSLVFLRNGDALTAAEVMEGLAVLARNEASFPLLGDADATKAVISVAVEALAWAREQGVI